MDSRQVASIRLSEAREGSPPSIGPQSIGIALTNACNLNCVTCWSYSPLRKELPRADWRRRRLEQSTLEPLFDDATALGTERVIFTGGGDPLAHPDFYGIATAAKAHGLKVTLISNLTLARDRETLAGLRLDTVLANFSCGDAETYAAFHPNRKPEEFTKLLDTLTALRNTGTALKLVFVVCSINATVLDKAIRIAASLGASVQWKRVSVTPDTSPLDLTETMRAQLLNDLPDLKRLAETSTVNANWEVFAAELRGEQLASEPITEMGCHAGHYYARVGANGDVRFCCNPHSGLRVGSLYETRFIDLWYSPEYATLRQQLHRGEFVPGCEQCGKLDMNRKVWQELRMLSTSRLSEPLRQRSFPTE